MGSTVTKKMLEKIHAIYLHAAERISVLRRKQTDAYRVKKDAEDQAKLEEAHRALKDL
jgi:hypothetical protein